MQAILAAYLLTYLLTASLIADDGQSIQLPKADKIQRIEVSYYNAQIPLLGLHETHLNILLPPEKYKAVLDPLSSGRRINTQSWSNDFLEVGTVLIQDRSGFFHRVCIFERWNNFETQFVSYEGKMYSVRAESTLDAVLLKIIKSVSKSGANPPVRSDNEKRE